MIVVGESVLNQTGWVVVTDEDVTRTALDLQRFTVLDQCRPGPSCTDMWIRIGCYTYVN